MNELARIRELLDRTVGGPPEATAYELVETLLAAWLDLCREMDACMEDQRKRNLAAVPRKAASR